MTNDEYISAGIKFVQPSWRLVIGGEGGLTVMLPSAPNRFHRFMQRVCFGFRWHEL